MSETETIRSLWREAAAKLGVQIQSPFTLHGDAGEIVCDAYLPEFGGPKGMVVCSRFVLDDSSLYAQLAQATKGTGLYASTMAVAPTLKLDEFIDALSDWGYYGPPDRRPPWLPDAAQT